MLTQDQIAYGQQKNREHMYQQAKQEFIEKYGRNPSIFKMEDGRIVDNRYIELCNQTNITPW